MLHMYRGSLPYTNFITLIFQNFPNIQLMRYLASFISLLRYKENGNNEIISPKIGLGKYLANVKFGWCDFFPQPKVALGKVPLYVCIL